jgi:hypothetical protein
VLKSIDDVKVTEIVEFVENMTNFAIEHVRKHLERLQSCILGLELEWIEEDLANLMVSKVKDQLKLLNKTVMDY